MDKDMTTCPNCGHDFGHVPKWEPGEKCQCGYAPPQWLYPVMLLLSIAGAAAGYGISRTFLGDTALGNGGLALTFLVAVWVVVPPILSGMGLLKNVK